MSNFKIISKNDDSNDFDAQVSRHRWKIVLTVMFIAAFILIIGWSLYTYLDRKVYVDYSITAKSVRSDSDTAQYMTFNGHILKYSRDGAEAFNGMNKTMWNVTYEMQKPHVATCDNFVALGDEGSNQVVVVDEKGNQTTIDTRLPIMDFTVASQGVVAVVLEDSGSTRINVYDKNGNQLAGLKCTMTQSGYPVDVSLSPNGTLLGVSYIRMSEGELVSSIAFYNFGDVGQNEVDNYVSGYDYKDSVFPSLKFLSDGTAVAIGDNRLVTFGGTQKPEIVSDVSFEDEIQSVYYGDSSVALVFRNNKNMESYRLDLYDARGKKILEKEFELGYTDIQLCKNQILIYNESKCIIMNKRGFVKYTGDFEDSVLLMSAGSTPGKYFLINRDITQMIRLN